VGFLPPPPSPILPCSALAFKPLILQAETHFSLPADPPFRDGFAARSLSPVLLCGGAFRHLRITPLAHFPPLARRIG